MMPTTKSTSVDHNNETHHLEESAETWLVISYYLFQMA
jgi:hypothetical protein